MKKVNRFLALFLVVVLILGTMLNYSTESNAASSIKVTLSDKSFSYTGYQA